MLWKSVTSLLDDAMTDADELFKGRPGQTLWRAGEQGWKVVMSSEVLGPGPRP